MYFYNRIDSKILTDDEQSKLFEMFEDHTNDRFLQLLRNHKSIKLVFHSTGEDMKLNRQLCIDTVYDKNHILVIMHSSNNNVCGDIHQLDE